MISYAKETAILKSEMTAIEVRMSDLMEIMNRKIHIIANVKFYDDNMMIEINLSPDHWKDFCEMKLIITGNLVNSIHSMDCSTIMDLRKAHAMTLIEENHKEVLDAIKKTKEEYSQKEERYIYLKQYLHL